MAVTCVPQGPCSGADVRDVVADAVADMVVDVVVDVVMAAGACNRRVLVPTVILGAPNASMPSLLLINFVFIM